MSRGLKRFLFLVAIFFVCSACYVPMCMGSGANGHIQVLSKAFVNGGMIPKKYTCDGQNISPGLNWINVPPSAKSIVVICDDPDAPMGTWVHWVIFNIPATLKGLAENIPAVARLRNGAIHGINDFRRLGYGGPCPPNGTHRYFFKIYALDTCLALKPGSTKAQVLKAMRGHIIATGLLLGKYKR